MTTTEAQTVWMLGRAEDPGGTPCEDRETAKAYAEKQYLDNEHHDDVADAVLTWDEHDCLNDREEDTGWWIWPAPVIRRTDLPTGRAHRGGQA